VHRFGDLVDDFVDFVGHVTTERLPKVAAATGQKTGEKTGSPSSPPAPPLPRVLGGHSLGGLVAAHAVLRLAGDNQVATPQSTGVAGLVLHSAALDVVWTPVLRALAAVGAVLAVLVPRARIVPAVKPEAMHPDPQVVREYLEDPHVVVGNTRARTANEVLRGFKGLAGKEELFALPILAVHGASDATTSLEAVRRFCARAASAAQGLVRLREVEGGFHELMAAPGEREKEAEEVAVWVEGLPEVRAGVGASGQQQQQQQQQPTSRL
jgi:acylglycerol lipase